MQTSWPCLNGLPMDMGSGAHVLFGRALRRQSFSFKNSPPKCHLGHLMALTESAKWDDVVLRTEREASDVLGTVLRHHQDVVFAVAASARLAVGDRDHRLH